MVDVNIKVDLSSGDVRMPASFGYRSDFRRSQAADINQIVENWQRGNTQIDSLQFPMDLPKYHMIMAIQTYKRRDLMTVEATLDTKDRIILPFPQALSDGQSVGYNDMSLGALGGNLAQGTVGMANDLSAGKSVAQSASGAIPNVLGAVGSVATDLAAKFGGDAAKGSMGGAYAMAGLSPNEFLTVLLTGPQYKRHNFTWHLVCRNWTEAIMIKKIIALLNNSMAPGLAFGGTMFNFPKVFQLALMPNYNYLFKFKPAVLERMQINYSTGSAPSFYHSFSGKPEDSPPESVQISLQFLELEFWLHSDFKDEALSPTDTRGDKRTGENVHGQAAADLVRDIATKAVENFTSRLYPGSTPDKEGR